MYLSVSIKLTAALPDDSSILGDKYSVSQLYVHIHLWLLLGAATSFA